MNIDFDAASVRLFRSQTLRLHDAAGSAVAVTQGAVWITQERDARDHIVTAGETFRIGTDGLTLVYGLQPASIVLMAPDHASTGEQS